MVLLRRKRLAILIALTIIFCSISFVGCKHTSQILKSEYSLSLKYDEVEMSLEGSEEIRYFNSSENSFTKLYFHLYPNAFREDAKNKVVSLNNWEKAYEHGDSWGYIEVSSVYYGDNASATFEVGGEDENILIVDLQEELFPDESVEIFIDFKVQLALVNHRLGVGENTINFGNFYPIACVYEEGKGFSQSLYHSNGDPFYSDCADYSVEIEYKSAFDIATTGEIIENSESSGLKRTKIVAENVRDFCFVLSAEFEKVSKNIEGTIVNYYGYKGDNDLEKCLETSTSALKTFNDMFGVYPYSQLSIVKANFIHGGMEFPNIVLVSDEVHDEDYQYVIVHEIAHQWWYGVVGNDQYNHAWQDEALAEYSTLLFFEKNKQYGLNYDDMIAGATQSYRTFVNIYTKVNGFVDGKMDKPLCEFQTEPEYVQCTYTKGVMMLDSIRRSMGGKKFIKALKNYYSDFKFKNADSSDLIASLNSACRGDMEGFIRSWLEDKVILE